MSTVSWGVFEDGLCISTAYSRAEAEGDRNFHTGGEDTGMEYKILELCPQHAEDEEPKGDCQECQLDGTG